MDRDTITASKTFTYTGSWAEVGATAKVHQYESPDYGSVVLILWPSGKLSILRETSEGPSGTVLSAEVLSEIDKFRFQSEVAIAVSPKAATKTGKKAK